MAYRNHTWCLHEVYVGLHGAYMRSILDYMGLTCGLSWTTWGLHEVYFGLHGDYMRFILAYMRLILDYIGST